MVKCGYSYVEGLANIAKRLHSRFEGVVVRDFKAPVAFCDYCGARVRYKIFFGEGLGLGSECASRVFRYLDMPVERLEAALKFFREYRELCEKAGVEPEAELRLRELDEKIKELRKLKKVVEQKKIERAGKNRDKIDFCLERRRWLSKWEVMFLESCRFSMTEKMENVLSKIYEKVKKVPEDEVQKQRLIEAKLRFVLLYGTKLNGRCERVYLIWRKAYDILENIRRNWEKPFTKKQENLIEKCWSLLVKKLGEEKWKTWIKYELGVEEG